MAAGDGELKDVSVTNKIQIMQRPRAIDHEKLLLRNASATGDWWPGICAVKCRRDSPEGNPRRTGESRNGHYHVSKIQRARAESSFEVVRSWAGCEAAAGAHEAGFSGYFYLVLPLVLERP